MNIFYYNFKLSNKIKYIIFILFYKKNILHIYTYSKKDIIHHNQTFHKKLNYILFKHNYHLTQFNSILIKF